MYRKTLFVAAFAACVTALPAAAQDDPEAQARPEAFEALVRCRSIADAAARLACFDTAAAAMEQAAERRDLVVVDRAQIRESRRRLFGLPLPRLGIFGDGNDEEQVSSIESTVASAHQAGYGRWVVRLEDGSTWAQTDNETLAARPRQGNRVRVERGALGSYRMRVNNQPAIRVQRQL